MTPFMHPDLAPDPARERCGNCGEPWEEHDRIHCESCGYEYRLCNADMLPNDTCDQHELEIVFRPESDEDRKADGAGARGL